MNISSYTHHFNPATSPYAFPAAPLAYADLDLDLYQSRAPLSGARFLVGGASFNPCQIALDTERVEGERLLKSWTTEWKRSVRDIDAPTDSAALSKTVEPLFSVMARFGPNAIDLTDFQDDRFNGVHMAVVLRATSSRKSDVPGWDAAFSFAVSALTNMESRRTTLSQAL